jgi:hypothetical protein
VDAVLFACSDGRKSVRAMASRESDKRKLFSDWDRKIREAAVE